MHSISCSPPAWGWSASRLGGKSAGHVLPTRVGMVRNSWDCDTFQDGAPHPRGDGPTLPECSVQCCVCSPPAWGWSASRSISGASLDVLPTRVGMVRTGTSSGFLSACAPHPRGDGPAFLDRTIKGRECSPPAWGWSGNQRLIHCHLGVLPTRVGMVRNYWCWR